ncbi:MAG: flagellar basal body L-ring protein FlgH [Candidatus Muiribacteriota bacterium]
MKIRLNLFISFLIIIGITASAASLWSASEQKSFYTEEKAHRIGDILTVFIAETSSASQSSTKDLASDFDASMNAGTGFMDLINSGSAGSSSSRSGSGSTEASNQVDATISVKVVEVLPNGNLVIEGKQYINVNDDIQEIMLQGEVRARDISTENTVDSRMLADAKILYKGKGEISKTQKPNLFQKIIGLIF